MSKTVDFIADTHREVRPHGTGPAAESGGPSLNTLVIRRTYNASPDDVWDAVTDPQRLERWFLPIKGDLREGGRFSLEGNASGEIQRCDKPTEIALTWEFGGGSSNVRLRLTPEGDKTVFELEHSPVPAEIIPNASPEMWGIGAGWEMGFKALDDYLAGRLPEGRAVDWIATAGPDDLMAAAQLADQISDAWKAVIAAGR